MGITKKGGNWENNTKDNPYDNYHGHQQQSGQSLQSSKSDTNKDPNITGKDPKNKKHKNK